MNLLQSFGRFFAMFIDDEEHLERRGNKPVQPIQCTMQNETNETFCNKAEVDDFNSDEMFEEFD